MTDGLGWGDAYSSTVERIKEQDEGKSRLGVAVLMWVIHAERPLKADELCHALAVELGSKDFNAGDTPLISILVGYCQGLITVDKETSTVRLIHPTAKEYLSTRTDIFSKPHSAMAEICLTYLNSRQVKALSADPSTVAHHKPFLEYCSIYWGIHAKRELSDHARSLALELLREYEDHISRKLLLTQINYLDSSGCAGNPSSDLGSDIDLPFSGLDCASFFGIVSLVATLSAMECYSDRIRTRAPTTLVWAARNGQAEVVELLVSDYTFGRNHRDYFCLTPLIHAVRRGHERVVEILLRCGSVGPKCPDNHGRTALSYAAEGGLGELVEILLQQQDVNPNEQDYSGNTPLSFAARNGHVRVVEILLEQRGISPDKPNQDHQTPLWYAASGGHEKVVKILLGQKGVGPDKPDNCGRTPLMCAAEGGHQDVVKILLELENVNPNYSDHHDRTPLMYAAEGGHEKVVKILLERENLDPNYPDGYGRTPLMWAIMNGHEGVVKILLGRKEVNPNKPDNGGQTPLMFATRIRSEGMITLLQSHSAETPA